MIRAHPDSLPARVFLNTGGYFTIPGERETRRAHAAEIPAVNGISNARGLAGMYAPLALGGAIGDVRLVGPDALARMRYPQSMSGRDATLLVATTFTLGFFKSSDNRRLGPNMSGIIGEHAFGAPGMGGNIGFADPEARMSFAYTMNRHGPGTGLNVRGQSLVDATYSAIGFRTDKPGFSAT